LRAVNASKYVWGWGSEGKGGRGERRKQGEERGRSVPEQKSWAIQ